MAAASLVDARIPSSHRLTKKTWILTIVVVLANALGNLSLTWGMKHQSAELGFSPIGYIAAIFQPWVALGIALLILWLLTRMTLLSWADLSFVLPVTSLGYVLSAVSGKYFFNEQISWQRWLGTLLIVGGIVLVGMTRPNTTAARSN
jgi:uncharacterized membrane protein